MDVGDQVALQTDIGTIIGKSLAGEWLVEWVQGTTSDILTHKENTLILIADEIKKSDQVIAEARSLKKLLDAADSLDQWWHNKGRDLNLNESLLFKGLCEGLYEYYEVESCFRAV